MKLHAKNGTLTIENKDFLPALELSEFELDNEDIKQSVVHSEGGIFTDFLPKGKYLKITAPILITRYYPIK